ncbi:MAG: hypothetical protein ACRDIF_00450, partial [Actinomycetota bacterium]
PGGVGSTRTPAVDPKATLDNWLVDAEGRAQQMVGAEREKLELLAQQADHSRQLEELFSAESMGRLVLFSPLDPTLGVVGLARRAASRPGALAGSAGSGQGGADDEGLIESVRLAVEAPYIRLAQLTGELGNPGISWILATARHRPN